MGGKNSGRKPSKNSARNAAASVSKPPIMKFAQASKIADKNSRTIVKILQLMEVTQLPGYAQIDTEKHVTKRIAKLTKRVGRRLSKLAKYADCPSDDRQAEFRPAYRGSIKAQQHSSSYTSGNATTYSNTNTHASYSSSRPGMLPSGGPIPSILSYIQPTTTSSLLYSSSLSAPSQTGYAPTAYAPLSLPAAKHGMSAADEIANIFNSKPAYLSHQTPEMDDHLPTTEQSTSEIVVLPTSATGINGSE